jgi:hypothetical protein
MFDRNPRMTGAVGGPEFGCWLFPNNIPISRANEVSWFGVKEC